MSIEINNEKSKHLKVKNTNFVEKNIKCYSTYTCYFYLFIIFFILAGYNHLYKIIIC